MRTRYQFGSLQLRKRRRGPDVWVFMYREAGARKTMTLGTTADFPNRNSALKRAEALRITANPDTEHPNVTLGAVIDKYVAEEMPSRYSTATFYQPWLRNYIRPKWGSYILRAIRALAVEQWLKALALAPKSKVHIRGLMNQLFKCAQRWEMTSENPIRLVRIKDASKRQREPIILNPKQFQAVLSYIPKRFQAMVLVAQCLGLRVSEVIGLKWTDIDWGNLHVLVQRAVVIGREGEVKTRHSRKKMPLDPALAAVLWEHYRQYGCCEWVFANPDTQRPYIPHRIQQHYLAPAGHKAGVGQIGWHTFRHTYSTQLRALRVDVKVQQELLRHSDIRTTLGTYTSELPQHEREANSRVVRMLLEPNGAWLKNETLQP